MFTFNSGGKKKIKTRLSSVLLWLNDVCVSPSVAQRFNIIKDLFALDCWVKPIQPQWKSNSALIYLNWCYSHHCTMENSVPSGLHDEDKGHTQHAFLVQEPGCIYKLHSYIWTTFMSKVISHWEYTEPQSKPCVVQSYFLTLECNGTNIPLKFLSSVIKTRKSSCITFAACVLKSVAHTKSVIQMEEGVKMMVARMCWSEKLNVIAVKWVCGIFDALNYGDAPLRSAGDTISVTWQHIINIIPLILSAVSLSAVVIGILKKNAEWGRLLIDNKQNEHWIDPNKYRVYSKPDIPQSSLTGGVFSLSGDD